ncbi:phage tail family protein [Geomicrobium sp. JCM 19038]|uniref:phage tail family protein n=1 Tax=Geomicrobium sp. JCM 19038 TaxID=1460635 RepID=UPI00045F3939|nr:phage tail family protein [Geomicrobium sp. JCM 19038]GAK09632.1 tail protein [Geomicrobium sp. JCM 19038]
MRVTYTNARGQSIVFARNSRAEHRIRDIQGLGGSDVETQMQAAPFQDGSTYLDTYMDPRSIVINTSNFGDTRKLDEKRRQYARVFNPKAGMGRLRVVTESGEDYTIFCLADGAPRFSKGGSEGFVKQNSSIELLAPNPYWLSTREFTEEMAAYVGGLSFPMKFFFFCKTGDDAIIRNDGDVATPVIIQFNGPSINPMVINKTTGQFVRINQQLNEGDVLEISTSTTNKYVRINGQNAMGYIDLRSVFWNLVPGRNVVSYEADEGHENARVLLKYRKQYVGI